MSTTSFLMSEQLLNVEFVQEIEKHPCLYNNRLEEYVRKDLTEKAWNKIGQKFNMPGSQCKEKWKNLRTVFSRNLRPPLNSMGKKRKPYYLFEAMKFALPFIKSRYTATVHRNEIVSSNSPTGSMEGATVDQEDEDNQDPIAEIKLEADVQSITCSPSQTPSPQSYMTPIPSPQINIMQPSSPRSYSLNTPPRLVPTKRNRSNDVYTEFHDNRISKEARTENNVDEMKVSKKRFLLSLLPDVYAMNNEQMRSFRIKLLNLIEEVMKTPEQSDVK